MKCMIETLVWKNMLTAVSQVDDEIIFNFNKDGLLVRDMNPSHTVMLTIKMPKSVWKSYEGLSEPVKLNVKEMVNRFKSSAGTVTIDYEPSVSPEFKVNITGKYGSRVLGHTVYELDEGEEAPAEVKKLLLDAKARLYAPAFKESLDDAGRLEDFCYIEGRKKPDMLVVYARKVASFDSSWTEFVDNKSLFELEVALERVKSCYSIEMLKIVFNAGMAFTNVCTIGFGDNFPLRVNFELPFEGMLEFFVAPRVEDKD